MLYLRSKLHNQKLKTKIRTSFIVLTVISIFAVTILSYTIASRELLRESEQTVAELLETYYRLRHRAANR